MAYMVTEICIQQISDHTACKEVKERKYSGVKHSVNYSRG